MRRIFAAALVLLAEAAMGQNDLSQYPQWEYYLNQWGYDSEAYTVETDDKWQLTLFRITGKTGEARL